MATRLAAIVAALTMIAPGSRVTAQVVVAGPIPPPPPGQYVPPDSSLRFTVTPKDAEVYVDGYYAGIVDAYDGTFQRLRVAPGPHDVTLFKDGFHSFSQKVYLSPNATFKIRHTLDALGPNEPLEARPVPPQLPVGQAPPPGAPPARTPGRREHPQQPPQQQPPPQPPATGHGTLALSIQPAGADVVIDGEPWRGPRGSITIELTAGRHNVQIRKAGYVGYLTDVDVRSGETTTLNVDLKQQP
jgi:PEGA domain